MAWPHWIEQLRSEYMADRASVFLVHGDDVERGRWEVEGRQVDCAGLLVYFLSRTRNVVGVFSASRGLHFPEIGDLGTFDRLLAVRDFQEGAVKVLSDDEPSEALGKIYRAMGVASEPQGYVISEAEKLWPVHKRIQLHIEGAPKMSRWPHDPQIRHSNNIVILLTTDLDKVQPELVNGAFVIALTPPEPVSAPEPVVEPEPTAELEGGDQRDTLVPGGGASAQAPAEEVDLALLMDQTREALRSALVQYDPKTFLKQLPVMHAVAAVVALHSDDWGALTLSLDDEGQVIAEGPGADAFLQTWRADITFDAAASMLLKELRPPQDGFTEETLPELDATPVRVLAKRIGKLL